MLLNNTGAHASRFRPSVRVDVVLIRFCEGLELVTEQRLGAPFRGCQVLPGSSLQQRETPRSAAHRVIRRYTKGTVPPILQLECFAEADRDPRGHVLSIPFLCMLPPEPLELNPPYSQIVRISLGDPKTSSELFKASNEFGVSPRFGFDHEAILHHAFSRLRSTISTSNPAFGLLACEFTLRELRLIHEAIHGETINKDNFRRKLLASNNLVATGQKQSSVEHRPAMLYRRPTVRSSPE